MSYSKPFATRFVRRRFGIGRFTTDEEVDFVVDLLEEHVTRLRDMSPLWEMVQEGIDLSTIQWSQDEGHDHGHGHGH
jgi:cysteine desulfurase